MSPLKLYHIGKQATRIYSTYFSPSMLQGTFVTLELFGTFSDDGVLLYIFCLQKNSQVLLLINIPLVGYI